MTQGNNWLDENFTGYNQVRSAGVPVQQAKVLDFGSGLAASTVGGVTTITGTGSAPLLVTALVTTPPLDPSVQEFYIASAYSTPGDGGGGTFVWNPTDARAADGGTVIAVTGIATGRWNRVYSGALDPRWFGAKLDNSTDDVTAWNAALSASSAGPSIVEHPGGISKVSGSLVVPTGTTLIGNAYANCQLTKTTAGHIISSTHPLNTGTDTHCNVLGLTLLNAATYALNPWQASHDYSLHPVGALLVMSTDATKSSFALLKLVTQGTSGAHRPLGQLTWITANGSAAYVGPNITLSGAPTSDLNFIVWITTGGILGTSQFKYSTDGGSTWSSAAATGASVSLTGGVTASFAAGTYVVTTYAASPTCGWSLAVGTSLTDGTCVWQLVDGGAGLADTGGGRIVAENISIIGTTVGILNNQTEVSQYKNVKVNTCGWAGVWLTDGGTYTPGADYGFTADLSYDKLEIIGCPIGIVDDGGAGHWWSNTLISACTRPWYLASQQNTSLQNVFVDNASSSYAPGTYDGLHGHSEFLLPDTSAFLATVGQSVAVSFDNVSADLNCGALLDVTSSGSLFHLLARNCYTYNPMFTGLAAGVYTFTDLGGNRCQNAPIVDAMPKSGGVFTTSVSNNNAGTPGLYWGLGINALPQNGITNNAGHADVPGSLAAGSLSTGATNQNVALPVQSVIEIVAATLSSAAAFALGGLVNNAISGGVSGQRVRLYSRAGQTMTITHQDAGSTAANRIICPYAQNLVLQDLGNGFVWVDFWYDETLLRWLVVGHSTEGTAYPNNKPILYAVNASATGFITCIGTDSSNNVYVGSTSCAVAFINCFTDVEIQHRGTTLVTFGSAGIKCTNTSVALGAGGTITVASTDYLYPRLVLTGSLPNNTTVVLPSVDGARWTVDASGVTLNGHTLTLQANSVNWGTTIATNALYDVQYSSSAARLVGVALSE